MKKIILGIFAIILGANISFAQPVSDMAVIPMGITIQNIMRLTITKGGNIEFVFKSAQDRTTGISGTAYTTAGTVVATQAWQIQLTADNTDFINESGVALGANGLDYVQIENITTASTGAATPVVLAVGPTPLITAGAVTSGEDFSLEWSCGLPAPGGTPIPTAAAAGRYTVNVLLSLLAFP